MNQELSSLKEAMDGGDFDLARERSDAYVKAHPEEFAEYADKTIESVVQAIDVFRAAGMEDEHYRFEAWHFHKWEPQTIGGAVQPRPRNSN